MGFVSTINTDGAEYAIQGITPIGTCATPAGTDVKIVSFNNADFDLRVGASICVKFTYANTYGDGSSTYPKLRIGNNDYAIRLNNGNYAGNGAWSNGQFLTFLFDGTDLYIM